METRTLVFLIIIAAIAGAGLLAFLIALLAGMTPRDPERSGSGPGAKSRETRALFWGQVLLGLAALAIAVVLLVWLVVHLATLSPGTPGWAENPAARYFMVIMLIIAGAGVVGLALFLLVRSSLRPTPVLGNAPPAPAAAPASTAATEDPKAEPVAIPSTLRLFGLVAVAVAVLLLGWIEVENIDRIWLMRHMLYPAGFAVALVILFDKATRGWSVKTGLESLREWLLCDLVVLLFVIGFLRLHRLQGAALHQYANFFWDWLYLVAFLWVIWLVDRRSNRLRFLAGFGYLTLLPIGIMIRDAAQGKAARAAAEAAEEAAEEIAEAAAATGEAAAAGGQAAGEAIAGDVIAGDVIAGDVIARDVIAEALSWWESIWPFFYWALIFFVLELILVIAVRRPENSMLGAVKDLVFVAVYAILLIIAA